MRSLTVAIRSGMSSSRGTFRFDVFANIVRETSRLDELVITAAWNAEQAGRADASVTA